MARSQNVRPVIKLRSTSGTGYTYVTRKNRRNDPDRMVVRKDVVARYASRRAELKKDPVNPHLTSKERAAAQPAVLKLPRDASPTRVRNRDVAEGRPRGVLRRFGLSSIKLRNMAQAGELPGVTTSTR